MLFLDSSAVVKCYVRELASDRVRAEVAEQRLVATSYLSYAEVLSAIHRKRRAGEITEEDGKRSEAGFVADWQSGSFQLVPLNPATLAAVGFLLSTHSLKGSDAVHLSAAVWLRDNGRSTGQESFVVRFVTADRQQLEAARRTGFEVLNPETS